MILSYVGILAGLGMLAYGADLFIDGAANIARHLGMPAMLVGLIVVGIATSAPEILVGSIAALEGKTEIAIGNAIGSNIANIGLVLGVTVIFIPISIASQTLKYEFLMMLATIMLAYLLMLDKMLSHTDATVLLIGMVVVILATIYLAKKAPKVDALTNDIKSDTTLSKPIILFIVGLALLLGGAQLLVECASTVAKNYGISDLVIGLTIIAIGTSLPELAASISAAKKNQASIALGNIIGSNMFNMLAVIGIPSMIHPIHLDNLVLIRDFPIMILFSLLMGKAIFIYSRGKLDKLEGSVLLCGFIAYQYWLFIS